MDGLDLDKKEILNLIGKIFEYNIYWHKHMATLAIFVIQKTRIYFSSSEIPLSGYFEQSLCSTDRALFRVVYPHMQGCSSNDAPPSKILMMCAVGDLRFF